MLFPLLSLFVRRERRKRSLLAERTKMEKGVASFNFPSVYSGERRPMYRVKKKKLPFRLVEKKRRTETSELGRRACHALYRKKPGFHEDF